MSNENNSQADEPQSVRPYWFPDVPVEDLPEGLQAAIEGIIGPGYRDLVMGARDTMERLAGTSLVHLTHLEVLDQIKLAGELPTAAPEDRQSKMASHARLAGAKLRALSLLHRLRDDRGPLSPAERPSQRPTGEPMS